MSRRAQGPGPAIVWLRQDLRLGDQPALRRAIERRAPVVPAFIWSPGEDGAWAPGTASRWWLHHSLLALAEDLRARGSRLIIRRGPALPALRDLARETGAASVLWNRCCEPARVAGDAEVRAALRAEGLETEEFDGSLLVEPARVRTGAGGSFRVFTPFWRALQAGPPPAPPLAAPRAIEAPARWPASCSVEELGLLPATGMDGLRETWTPGERGARAALARFVGGAGGLASYGEGRNAPGNDGTSRLSPHLHWGELSPRQAWDAAWRAGATGAPGASGAQPWLRQLAWREFSSHALLAHPDAPERPLRAEFEAFPWRRDARALRAWQQGRTGLPLVDAGMRQLQHEGWMHGRVRMVAASFLVKHLLLPWQDGERWFWDRLVDADLANNALSWQWVAGCGHDAAPYFRIFNPVLQGRKFDADGSFVRRFVPELARLPTAHVHAPWLAPASMLAEAGIRLGRDYPAPIVDHAVGRQRALEALGATRRAAVERPRR